MRERLIRCSLWELVLQSTGFFVKYVTKKDLVMNQFIAIADAAAATGSQSGGGFISLVPMLVIFGVMIFFMIRSQKKQAQKRQQMIDRIKKGDRIITAGGVHATVIEVKDKTFIVEIADKVKIEISKSGVNTLLNGEGA